MGGVGGGGGVLGFSLCVCVWRAWWISKKHTHNTNYTPTYINLVPAFIRLFDKLGNYNNKIALRPWSSQCCDWAAHLASHHLPLCVHLWDCLLRLRLAHLNNAPARSTTLVAAVMILTRPSLIFCPSLRVCLTVSLSVSTPLIPAWAQLNTVFLVFGSRAVVAALCMRGASERSSLCTS